MRDSAHVSSELTVIDEAPFRRPLSLNARGMRRRLGMGHRGTASQTEGDSAAGVHGQVMPAADNPTMVVTLDAKRRLMVPAALAPTKPGDCFDAHFDVEADAIVFRRLGGRENWLAVLKECPVSPDDVPRRRREPAKRRKL